MPVKENKQLNISLQQKRNYSGSVASCDTRPGNEVGLFYNGPEHHTGITTNNHRILNNASVYRSNIIHTTSVPMPKHFSELKTLFAYTWHGHRHYTHVLYTLQGTAKLQHFVAELMLQLQQLQQQHAPNDMSSLRSQRQTMKSVTHRLCDA